MFTKISLQTVSQVLMKFKHKAWQGNTGKTAHWSDRSEEQHVPANRQQARR